MVTKTAPSPESAKKPAPIPTTPTQTKPAPAPVTQGPPKETTEVTKWLNENNAAEFVDAFYKKGFYYKEDLTDDELKELIPDERSGVRNMLSRLLKEEKKEPPVPEKPELPKGVEWDLSSKELELPTGIKFEIPDALQVPKDDKAVISPASMTPEQWIFVARNSCMLYGRRMDGIEPAIAPYPVLHWKVPSSNNFVRSEHLAAEVKSELTYTETSSNYVRQGFLKADATLSVPYCAASAEREENEKHASSAKTTQMFMTGIWHYPRARVLLEECTVVSSQFIQEIDNAIGIDRASMEIKLKEMGLGDNQQPTDVQCQLAKQRVAEDRREEMGLVDEQPPWVQSDEEATQEQMQNWHENQMSKREAGSDSAGSIERVLLKYGHIVGWSIDLGGRLFFVHHKEGSANANTHKENNTTRAAVGIKTSTQIAVQADAGIAIGIDEDTGAEAYRIAETTSFTALGGDTTLASSPQLWASTVKDPNLWAVIGMAEIKYTVDLLPEPEHGLVKQLWKKYGRRGPLDGYSARLKAYPDGPYIVPMGDWVGLMYMGNIYGSGENPIWNIGCFPGENPSSMYFLEDNVSKLSMCGNIRNVVSDGESDAGSAGRLPMIGYAVRQGLAGCGDAAWHIHPVDPDGTYGSQYQDCYLLESQRNGCLLMPRAYNFDFLYARLPLSEFSPVATYSGVSSPDKNLPFERILTVNTNGDISARQLMWKFEWVEDD
jgi:hypothetical protein